MKTQDMREQLVQMGNGAHALATQILGNADEAADAVQEAIARVLGKPGAYDERKGALAPWFLRLVRNHCIDLLRRRRATSVEVETLQSPGPGPEAMAEMAQRDGAIRAALASLSAERREIIVLRDYMDLSYAEIATVLDLAPGTVMSRLHRARMELKERLARYE
jgi:RNA polymerase sigma-70 factor (ECF subfamily)